MNATIRSVSLSMGIAVAAAGGAHAADLYTPPPVQPVAVAPFIDWTGFYIGLHAGYGWGDVDGATSYLPSPAAFGASPFNSSTDLDGFIGGAQVGFNWQIDTFLLGVEADISWSGMDGEHLVTPLSTLGGVPVPGWFQDGKVEMDWFGTLRARAGVLATPNLLVYATGGLAFGSVDYKTFTSFTPAPPFQYVGGSDSTETGWTVGGGLEWGFAPNWTVKAEYLYFDLGDTSYIAPPLAPNPPFAVTQSFDTTGSIVRAGINYRFSY